jgi:uncharacterized lipoprotein YddW (UPF0748 family)
MLLTLLLFMPGVRAQEDTAPSGAGARPAKSATPGAKVRVTEDTQPETHESEKTVPRGGVTARPGARPARTAKEKALADVAPYRRAIWVTRWDYASAADVRKIMYNAASARFSDVFFQVRGAGTVFYKSKIEPWAFELTSKDPATTGRDPGWDPLAVAVAAGKEYGLRVHAYLNVMPGWTHDTAPPASAGALWTKKRSWFCMDADGDRMQPGGWYSFLDPGIPEVRLHLANLFREVAQNYDVDGVHLDYIRYPLEKGDYSYNPSVVQAFRKQTGGYPAQRAKLWDQYRRDQVTATVTAISQAVRSVRPGIEITAAVVAEEKKCRDQAFQSPEVWLEQGIIDAVTPMAYTDDADVFAKYAQRWRDAHLEEKVWMGVWADPNRVPRPERDARRTITWKFGGVAIFSYENLFTQHKANKKARTMYDLFTDPKP